MSDDEISAALVGALAARPEIADRPDRCRAALSDLLGHDAANRRREIGLLVAAVEERVPEALRSASNPTEVESITTRFREDRALEPAAAQWAVNVWSDALRSAGSVAIPSHASSGKPGSEPLSGATTNVSGVVGSSEADQGAPSVSVPGWDRGRSAASERSERTRKAPGRGRLFAVIAIVAVLAIGGATFLLTRGGSDPYPNAAERALLKHLPQESSTCSRHHGEPFFDGQQAAISCTAHAGYTVEYVAIGAHGTKSATEQLQDHFKHEVDTYGPPGKQCFTAPAFNPATKQSLPTQPTASPSQPVGDAGPGQLLCAQVSGNLYMFWTNERLHILAAATSNGEDTARMLGWFHRSAGPCIGTCSAGS